MTAFKLNLKGKNWIWWGAIALLSLLVLTLLAAPNTNKTSGSTYSRAPDGYGAWYNYMAEQEPPIFRWQRPTSELLTEEALETPKTLLRVHGGFQPWGIGWQESTWVEQGNRLVIVGTRAKVTEAQFRSTHPTDFGLVTVETGRRLQPQPGEEAVLSDDFGAIALRQPLGEGEVIYIVYPYFAANAYQNSPGNFAFLRELVNQSGYEIWIDEYLHGYKDEEVVVEEVGESWVDYLVRTPIVLVAIQLGVLLLVLFIAENQRFGKPQPLATPQPNNSKAYINALASVLHKAGSSEFVLNSVGKAEQLQIQRALGLGTIPLDPEEILDTWTQQTGRPPTELAQLLHQYQKHRKISDANLLAWIRTIQNVHQQLPS
jgi:hypothetical protein